MDMIDQIFKQLSAGKGKDSPEIVALLATIKSVQPNLYDVAVKIVDNYVTKPIPTSVTGGWPSFNTLMGSGVGLAGLASTPWIRDALQWLELNHHLRPVTDPIWLLAIVAGLGATSGAAYSIYVHRGVVRPAVGQKDGVLTLTRYGILNEIFFGAVAAVTTIWLATVGLAPANASVKALVPDVTAASPNPPPTNPAPANPAPVNPAPENPVKTNAVVSPLSDHGNGNNLLSYSVIAGSLISGWYGARMRSFRLGQDLLQGALAETAVTDRMSPEMAARILAAPTAATAANLATGKDVVGANLPKSLTPTSGQKSELDSKLFKLLDETRVRMAASNSGPINRDGAKLTLNQLQAFDVIDPIIRQVLGGLNLKEVANMSMDDFTAKAKAVGLDLPQLALLLATIQSAAKDVVSTLDQQPANWTWPA